MNRIQRGLPGFAALLAALLLPLDGLAASITLTRVVDTTETIPGGSDAFQSLSAPSLDRGTVAFGGQANAGIDQGIYTSSGGPLTVIADSKTVLPGSLVTFESFSAPSFAGATVAFGGQANAGIDQGIYTGSGGPLTIIADTETVIPGSLATFQSFSAPSLDGTTAAFQGAANAGIDQGIYTGSGGPLAVIADVGTPIPGGPGNFQSFSPPSIDAGNVAFGGGANAGIDQGIYTGSGGPIVTVADEDTLAPGTTDTFSSFSPPGLDTGIVVFDATAFPGFTEGIYRSEAGVLEVVADTNTMVPEGGGVLFEGFGDPAAFNGTTAAIDAGNVAFIATSSALTTIGIYVQLDGLLIKAIDNSQELGGQAIAGFGLGPEALAGNQLAFRVDFFDFSSAIYVAEITAPEPGAAVLLVLVGCAISLRRRPSA